MPGTEPPNETPIAAPPDLDPIREKAIRLFRYLTALAELRAKNVRDVSSYESVFWFAELPHEKECYTAAWDGAKAADEEIWLRIERPERPVLAQPPAECKHWIDAATLEEISPEPRLLEEIIDPQWVPGTVDGAEEPDSVARPRLLLSDHPRVASAWEAYLKTIWRPWSVQYLRWERVQRAYRKLFAIYQEQQRRGEQYELVLGVGVLVWTTPNDHKVCRPIVTAQATIELESESGSIAIAPAVDGANFALEQDMMEVNERPPIHDQRQVEGKVSSLESPWDREVVTPMLKCWLYSLPSAADAVYHDALECPDRSTRVPQMAFSPILMLRKRGAQSTREALKKIVKGLSDGKPIPRGVRQLCGALDEPDLQHELKTEGASPADDILFPLPTNDEQLAIIRRLHGHSGVLVQGPPGTGKSHTIVNLVCHLLAQGRRVLVTSQTPRALKVLREKIPEAILPLVVSLLGEDSESRQNLEYSVQGILRHVNAADLVDPMQLMSEMTRERASLRSRLSALRRRLREVREAETTVYCIPGTPYQGTAQTIAQILSRDHPSLSWLTDQISAGAEPPLTDGELKELHSFWEQYCERSITYALPAPDSLPTGDQLEAAQKACARTGDGVRQSVDSSDVKFAQPLCELGRDRLEELRKIAEDAVQLSEWLAKRAEPWIAAVRQEVLEGRVLPWNSLEKATSKVLEALAGKTSEADITAPAGVSRPQLLADATDLLAHLEHGGSLGFWVFRPEVVQRCLYILRETRFAGRPCNSPAVINSLLAHLQQQDALDRAWLEWSAIVEPPEGTARHRLACLEQHHEVLRSILRLGSLASNVENASGERRPNGTPDRSCWWRELMRNVQTAIALWDDHDSQAALSVLIDRIAKRRILVNPHPILDDLIVAAEQSNVPEYRTQLAKLVDLHHERSQAERCLSLDRRLRESAPTLADALKSPEARPAMAAQLASFGRAWAWKRAMAWLEQFSAEQSADVSQELDAAERRLQDATATLVALKAWTSCRDKLASDSMQQGALIAWQLTVKKLGKQRGKYVETYRRDARKYLQQCRNAIPAWIMPLYRVAEQVEIEPGIFDVVIVDESSQMGPEGLILQYLAKQCVIVGDDKQISPEGGFIEGTQVRTLMEQHLGGLPFSETLGPATSLFDQAAVRYGNRITLREHFRCMPEIIRFSDELCYADTPLIPLRQYPPSRLPPLQVRFVVDGYREGTAQQAVNRPEAAAVAKTLIECLDDPRYKGKSFGVICLQGRAQAQLIENMILDKLGPHPFKDESIRLLCGDPYSFQGRSCRHPAFVADGS